MLIDSWERLRGFNRWPETQGRVEAIHWWGIPDYHNQELGPRWNVLFKVVQIVYAAHGGAQYSQTVLFPALGFALDTGDELAIRYSPLDPERVYVRSRTVSSMFVIILGLMALGLATALIYLFPD